MFIYDAEIVKAIQGKNEAVIPGIKYCQGWRDFDNMGISVVCGYDYRTERYRIFMEDNMDELRAIFDDKDNFPFVGFNSKGFDNKLLVANNVNVNDMLCYDILQKVWVADGLEPEFRYPSHIGYGLDDIVKVNFNRAKSGHGALAPVQWQRREYGSVVDYCLEDVRLTKMVMDQILLKGTLINPKNGKQLFITRP